MFFQKSKPPPRIDRMEVKVFGAAVSGEGWGLPALVGCMVLVLVAFYLFISTVAEHGINVTVRVVQEAPPTPEKPPP